MGTVDGDFLGQDLAAEVEEDQGDDQQNDQGDDQVAQPQGISAQLHLLGALCRDIPADLVVGNGADAETVLAGDGVFISCNMQGIGRLSRQGLLGYGQPVCLQDEGGGGQLLICHGLPAEGQFHQNGIAVLQVGDDKIAGALKFHGQLIAVIFQGEVPGGLIALGRDAEFIGIAGGQRHVVITAVGGLRRTGIAQIESAVVALPNQLIAGVATIQRGVEFHLLQSLAGELGALIVDLHLAGRILQSGERIAVLPAGYLEFQRTGGAGGDLKAAGGPTQLAAVFGNGVAAEVRDVDLSVQHVSLFQFQSHLAALVAGDGLLLAVNGVGYLVAGGTQQGGGGHISGFVHQPVVDIIGTWVELGGRGDDRAALIGELGHQIHIGLVVYADVAYVAGVTQRIGSGLQRRVIDGDITAQAFVDAEGAGADTAAGALLAVAGAVFQAGAAYRCPGGIL